MVRFPVCDSPHTPFDREIIGRVWGLGSGVDALAEGADVAKRRSFDLGRVLRIGVGWRHG